MTVKEILNKYYKDHIQQSPLLWEWYTYLYLWCFYLATMDRDLSSYVEDDSIKMISKDKDTILEFVFNPWSVIVNHRWKIETIDNIEAFCNTTYRF